MAVARTFLLRVAIRVTLGDALLAGIGNGEWVEPHSGWALQWVGVAVSPIAFGK